MKYFWCLLLAAGAMAARADSVVLKSGAVLTGEIVGEDAYEVRILVSRTKAGDIRTIKAIDQTSVESLQRDAPEVPIESEPAIADGVDEAAAPAVTPMLVDPAAMHEAIKRADALTGEGHYDDAIRTYRAVIDAAERQDDALRDSLSDEDRHTRLEMLRLRDETYALLLIALQGRLDAKRAALDEMEARAQQVARDMTHTRDEMDDLARVSREDEDAMRVRRLGEKPAAPTASARQRELQARLDAQEQRLQQFRQRATEARLALVNLESEIQVAREKSHQAAVDYSDARRASRVKR